jgi:hypothetical protein
VYEELTNNIETGTLFLLKGAPRKWLEPTNQIRVERLATYYGDISFTVDADKDGRSARAKVSAPAGPWKLIEIALGRADIAAPRSVQVNGIPHTDFDARGNVRLHPGAAAYAVEVGY